jgi:hypothetical protein
MKLPPSKVPVELVETYAQHTLIHAYQVTGDPKLVVKKALAAERIARYRRRRGR